METTAPARANTAGEGVRYAPYGLLGGTDGLPHRYRIISKGKTRWLKTKEVGVPVMPGDVFFVESAGGGGYGPPARRSAAARDSDAANGFVSRRGTVGPRSDGSKNKPARKRRARTAR